MTPADTALRQRVTSAFATYFGEQPSCIIRAPGRVNLIGEHTDYNDGFVLPCAIGPATMVAASARLCSGKGRGSARAVMSHSRPRAAASVRPAR